MAKTNIYLIFNGEAEEAFNFYKSAFGGEFGMMQRFKEIPEKDRDIGKIEDEEGEKLIHISLPISEETSLMASDGPRSMGNVIFGNNFSIYVESQSKEEADKIFTDLSVGGKVKMELTDTFWGAYYGMLEDKFGINWMIGYTYPKK